MVSTNEVVIELSKKKIVLLLLVAATFIAIGIWMLLIDEASIEAQRRFNNVMLIRAIGASSVLFFGLCGLYGVKKLFDRRPGLVISPSGIVDNVSGAGHISWSDISGFGVYEVHNQKMLVIKLYEPEKYIGAIGSIKKLAARTNLNLCGSPIAISVNTLKTDFETLSRVVVEAYEAHLKTA